jgi:Protein of unknown function (DUF2950)
MNSDIPEIEKAHLQRLAMLLSLGVGFFMLASKMLCTTTSQPTRQARWAVLEGLARRGAEPPGRVCSSASSEDYSRGDSGPTPFHGYLFRLLTAQGPAAPGGARAVSRMEK